MKKTNSIAVILAVLVIYGSSILNTQTNVAGTIQIDSNTVKVTYTGGLSQTLSVSNLQFYNWDGTPITDLSAANQYARIYLVNATGSKFGTAIPLTYDADKKWHVDGASISSFPNGEYSLNVEVSNVSETNADDITTKNFTIKHEYYFSDNLTASYIAKDDSVTLLNSFIPIATTYTGSDNASYIGNASATVHKYSVINKWGKTTREGNLTWDGKTSLWLFPSEVPLAWSGQGNQTLKVEFQFKGYDSPYTLQTSYERGNSRELIILILGIAGVLTGVIVTVAVVYIKKKGHGLDRYEVDKKKKKESEIKVIEISTSDIKKARKGKLPAAKKGKVKEEKPKKEKGKTQESEDLIFSVPQWEVDELDEGTGEVEQEVVEEKVEEEADVTATGEVQFNYNMHCPSCNSWYQVDRAEGVKCPDCGVPLNVAVWCQHCQKWFDVPKPGKYACPICQNPLSFKK
ncbi:MAG: CHY zinc finger protein [Promethearchaeota archaeon]